MITVDQQSIKHYQGTPYIHAAPAAVMPGNCETDQSPRWFAFTADFTKVVVGGVATEAQLKSILKGSPALEAALSHVL